MKNWTRSQVRALHAYLLWQWARWRRGPQLPLTPARALIFAPHPDDETIGCGGLIALKRQAQTPVGIVFLTDGRHCYGADGPPENEVVETRYQEALGAARILQVPRDQVFFLGMEDGSLSTLSGDARTQAIARIASLIGAFAPGEIYVPHRQDRHKDHEAAFALVREALRFSPTSDAPRFIEYVIWHLWEAPLFRPASWQQAGGAHYLPIESVLPIKRQAVSAYVSQLALLPRGFVWEHSHPVELFYAEEPE